MILLNSGGRIQSQSVVERECVLTMRATVSATALQTQYVTQPAFQCRSVLNDLPFLFTLLTSGLQYSCIPFFSCHCLADTVRHSAGISTPASFECVIFFDFTLATSGLQ